MSTFEKSTHEENHTAMFVTLLPSSYDYTAAYTGIWCASLQVIGGESQEANLMQSCGVQISSNLLEIALQWYFLG